MTSKSVYTELMHFSKLAPQMPEVLYDLLSERRVTNRQYMELYNRLWRHEYQLSFVDTGAPPLGTPSHWFFWFVHMFTETFSSSNLCGLSGMVTAEVLALLDRKSRLNLYCTSKSMRGQRVFHIMRASRNFCRAVFCGGLATRNDPFLRLLLPSTVALKLDLAILAESYAATGQIEHIKAISQVEYADDAHNLKDTKKYRAEDFISVRSKRQKRDQDPVGGDGFF